MSFIFFGPEDPLSPQDNAYDLVKLLPVGPGYTGEITL